MYVQYLGSQGGRGVSSADPTALQERGEQHPVLIIIKILGIKEGGGAASCINNN